MTVSSINLADSNWTRDLFQSNKSKAVSLPRFDITDRDLESFAVLVRSGLVVQPEILDLSGTAITDAGLAHLATIAGYHYLFLSRTQITDGGVAELVRHPTIRWIDLSDTKITNLSLLHLSTLPELSTLYAERTAISRPAIDDFTKSLWPVQLVDVVADGYPPAAEINLDLWADQGRRTVDHWDWYHEQEETPKEIQEEAPAIAEVQSARLGSPHTAGGPLGVDITGAGANSRTRTLEPAGVG